MNSNAFLRQLVRVNQLQPGTRTLIVGADSDELCASLRRLGIQVETRDEASTEPVAQKFQAIVLTESWNFATELQSAAARSASAEYLAALVAGGSLGMVRGVSESSIQSTTESLVSHLAAFESPRDSEGSIRIKVVRKGMFSRQPEAILATLDTAHRQRTAEQWLQIATANRPARIAKDRRAA